MKHKEFLMRYILFLLAFLAPTFLPALGASDHPTRWHLSPMDRIMVWHSPDAHFKIFIHGDDDSEQCLCVRHLRTDKLGVYVLKKDVIKTKVKKPS